MPGTTLISLVSDQPMPNVLFIQQMPRANRYVFLTTERMEQEGKADLIRQVCGIAPEQVDYLLTHHEDIEAIDGVWAELGAELGTRFIVNLTGGTKVMALGTLRYFVEHHARQSEIYYLPFSGSHLQQMYPGTAKVPLGVRVGVRDYLKVHGVQLLDEQPWAKQAQAARAIFNHVAGKKLDLDIQNALNEARTDPNELQLKSLDAAQRRFYAGEWLEVWLAQAVAASLGVSPDDILQGARLNKSGREENQANEYDVIFVHHNRLYLAECKYFTSASRKLKDISKELFKLGGANNLLGLNARPFLAMIGSLTGHPEDLAEQCRILRLRPPAFLDTLSDAGQLRKYLQLL